MKKKKKYTLKPYHAPILKTWDRYVLLSSIPNMLKSFLDEMGPKVLYRIKRKPQKQKTETFTETFSLEVNENDSRILMDDFRRCFRVYNDMVTVTTKLWRQVRKTREYKNLIAKIKEANAKGNKKVLKTLYQERKDILDNAGFNSVGFDKIVGPIGRHHNIYSDIAQTISKRVWQAWEAFFYRNGKEVHYRKFEEFVSFRGKAPDCGIILYLAPDGGYCVGYRGIKIPIALRSENTPTGRYQREALKCRVKYCAFIRQWVKNKWKYYVQVVFEGRPPLKKDNAGQLAHPIGSGKVGIDAGTQTIAVYGKDACDLCVLAPSALAQEKSLVNEIAKIQRAMDRSRRATNPQHYNDDGTIRRLRSKHGHKQIRKWTYSKHYYSLQKKLKDLRRKLAAIRKEEHYILANKILQYGNEVYVEDMNYKALQKRAKETKINTKTGQAYSKKRFGKSLSRCAPALFISRLGQKIACQDGTLKKINPVAAKASQFDHTDDSYTKKKLNERNTRLSDGTVVQRDLYSAFLLAHYNVNSMKYESESLKNDFKHFLEMHADIMQRLKTDTGWLPSSMGI